MSGTPGLDLNSSNNVVRGLKLTGFFSNGIDASQSGTLIELNLLTDIGPGGNGTITLFGQDHIVRNNTITDNRTDATASAVTTGVLIRDNTVTDNDRDGIQLAGSDHMVLDNVVTNNGEVGMAIGLSGSNNRVEGDTITGNGEEGLQIVGSDNLIIDNLISGNGEEGIFGFFNLSGDGLEMRDNEITNNGKEGVHLQGTGVTIAGNTITGNGSAEIQGDDALRVRLFGSTVAGNIIVGNHQNGLALMTNSTTSEISGNTISDNADNGAHFFGAGGSVFRNNDVTGNGANGILVDADIIDLLISGPDPAARQPQGLTASSGVNDISGNGEAGIFLSPRGAHLRWQSPAGRRL